MKKPAVWIVVIFGLAFLAMMYTSVQGLKKYRAEACMEFQGRQACRTASAATAEQARRTAIENACAQISSGMTDSIACHNSTPVKFAWLEGQP